MGKASRRRKASVSARGRLDAATRARRVDAVEARAREGVADRAQVLNQLQRIPASRARLDARQRELVDQARVLGVEWSVIGAALQVSPQAVAKRYGSTRSE